jgi:Predicted membrane protein
MQSDGNADMNLLFTYLSVGLTFVAIDMVWLKIMVERLYRPVLGDMLRADPNLAAAAAFYLLYPIGLIWFAVLPRAARRECAARFHVRRDARLLQLCDV